MSMKFLSIVFCACLWLAGAAQAAEPININAADSVTLQATLAGIGEKKADAIIQYRQANGPFKSFDDLNKVAGIGEKLIGQNRDKIAFGPMPTDTPAVPAATPPAASVPATPAPAIPAAPTTPVSTPVAPATPAQ
jgi:competence protein ComEA